MIKPFKGRRVDPIKRVFAYRNLHSGKWSLKQEGVVVAHADDVILFGCQLKVSEAGRQRVLREGKKNVHAGVEGMIAAVTDPFTFGVPRKLSYNPYRAPSFMVSLSFVSAASYVHLDSAGKAWVMGSVA